jgi:hypothetical protein
MIRLASTFTIWVWSGMILVFPRWGSSRTSAGCGVQGLPLAVSAGKVAQSQNPFLAQVSLTRKGKRWDHGLFLRCCHFSCNCSRRAICDVFALSSSHLQSSRSITYCSRGFGQVSREQRCIANDFVLDISLCDGHDEPCSGCSSGPRNRLPN